MLLSALVQGYEYETPQKTANSNEVSLKLVIFRIDKSLMKFCTNYLFLIQLFEFKALDDPVIRKIAQRLGCTSAQVCIGYALSKDVLVVTKTEKIERMKENLHSIEISKLMTPDDIEAIDKLNRNQRIFVDVYSIK